MKLRLLYIGKTSFDFIDQGVKLFQKRIEHFTDFETVCLTDIKNVKNMPIAELKKKEGQAILNCFNTNDFICLLDENGLTYSSVSFGEFLEKKIEMGLKNLTFVIGGAYGFSEEVYKRANMKLSLSKMTFSHQIIRLIFMEQLYRAYTIVKGIPYHNN